MKPSVALLGLMLATGYLSAQQEQVTEQKINLKPFGFHAGSCISRENVYFLDRDHLILSAPSTDACDKSTYWKALPTRLTVIDLHGSVIATKERTDLIGTYEGPLGYAAVCTTNSIELVSSNLNTATTIPTYLSKYSFSNPCFDIGGLSPSRTAISIHDNDDSDNIRYRLFLETSPQPIAEVHIEKGRSMVGITNSGYAICTTSYHQNCSQLTVNGSVWTGDASLLEDMHGGAFLSPDEFLLSGSDKSKVLTAISPDGTQTQVADLHGHRPPYINASDFSISAIPPRRVLYFVTGCYLGDFDDCYGLFYHRFVIFDPQTHKALFEHSVNADSHPTISPDGHIVAVVDKTDLHLYNIP